MTISFRGLISLNSEYVLLAGARPLFNQSSESIWQQPAIQGVPDQNRPDLMEILKQTRRHSRPIVNRHGDSSQHDYTAPLNAESSAQTPRSARTTGPSGTVLPRMTGRR